MNVVSRFTDLCEIEVHELVEDNERFLDFLKNSGIAQLNFSCDQSQDLFD